MRYPQYFGDDVHYPDADDDSGEPWADDDSIYEGHAGYDTTPTWTGVVSHPHPHGAYLALWSLPTESSLMHLREFIAYVIQCEKDGVMVEDSIGGGYCPDENVCMPPEEVQFHPEELLPRLRRIWAARCRDEGWRGTSRPSMEDDIIVPELNADDIPF
jgi:hypothetical protein